MPSLDNSIKLTVTTEANGDGLAKTEKDIATLGKTVDEGAGKTAGMNNAFSNFADTLKRFGEYFIAYQVVSSIEHMFGSFISGAGELEQTNIAFQSLIGNADEANSVFGQLVQYANLTPFQSKDVEKAAQTLMGFGTAGQQTVDIIKQLGDVVSVGGGDMQALSLVTGQIFAQGKLRAQDMYQVINDGGAGLVKIMAQNVGGMQNLTAEFDKGGIPASQYFDAVKQATAQGGFAFQGAQREAETFNGRISTLKDSALQFGMALIGVRIDPKLGLQIQEGGLFDKMKSGIGGLTSALNDLQPKMQKVIPQLIDNFGELAHKISVFLGPSVEDLWKTLTTKVMPALENFWHQIIEPLIPVVGGAFMVAIKAVVDILDELFKIVVPVINFLADHKWVVEAMAGAFVLLRTSMMLGAAFDAIKVGVATLQLVTLPSLVTSIGVTSAAWATAFPVAGILADIGLVAAAIDSVLAAKKAVDQAYNAATNSETSYQASHARLLDLKKNGTAAQQAAAQKALLAGYALGGYTGPGPSDEVAGVVHKGEYVVPQRAVDQNTGLPKSMGATIHIANVNLNGANAVREFFAMQDQDLLLAGRGMAPNRGVR